MDNHEEIMRGIGRLEGQSAGILDHLKVLNGSVKEQEKRLLRLEMDNANHKGVAAGISMAISIIVGVASFFLGKKI